MTKQILYLGLDPTHYQSEGHITHCPLIQIQPRPPTDKAIEKAFKNFNQYSHVIVTSKTTVSILANYLPLFGYSLQDWFNKMTLAIGQITASHLRSYGIAPQIIAKEETAEGLVAELKTQPLNKAFIFWPHSALSRTIISDFCHQHEIKHENCIFYDTLPYIPLEIPVLENFDEIIFTSPSTVDAFLRIFKSFPSHKILTPIGPITTHYLNNK